MVVAPATGGLGGAAVMVAIAVGATVIAIGRNETTLIALARKFEGRVKTVKITGDVEKDADELKNASGGSIDAVFDIPPPTAAQSTHMKSCIAAIKNGGRISLMGGIFEDIHIPYHVMVHKNLTLKGTRMYGRDGDQNGGDGNFEDRGAQRLENCGRLYIRWLGESFGCYR